MNPFTVKGVWLKACLHCHTTESDGALSPKGVVSYYKKHGYKVVALTDHNKITYVEDDDVITFPGVEIGVGKGLAGHSFHVVAINIKEYEKFIAPTDEDSVVITCLYVKEGYRGRGFGKILLKYVIEEIRKRGFRIVETYACLLYTSPSPRDRG